MAEKRERATQVMDLAYGNGDEIKVEIGYDAAKLRKWAHGAARKAQKSKLRSASALGGTFVLKILILREAAGKVTE